MFYYELDIRMHWSNGLLLKVSNDELPKTGSLHNLSGNDMGEFWELFNHLKQIADYD